MQACGFLRQGVALYDAPTRPERPRRILPARPFRTGGGSVGLGPLPRRARLGGLLAAFPFDKRLLALYAPAVAAERAIAADDPVAGDDDGDRIGGAGTRHGSGGAGLPDPTREVSIARGGAGRDAAKRFPDLALEGSPAHIDRQIEMRQRAGGGSHQQP